MKLTEAQAEASARKFCELKNWRPSAMNMEAARRIVSGEKPMFHSYTKEAIAYALKASEES